MLLFGYSNVKDNELYVSLKKLDVPLGAAMIYGPNDPGIMGVINTSFGGRGLNVVAFGSFGIGKSSMTELIAQEYRNLTKPDIPQTPSPQKHGNTSKHDQSQPEVSGFIKNFNDAVEELKNKGFTVHSQSLVRVLSEIPLLPKSAVPISIERHAGTSLLDIRLTDLVISQLGLDESKEYDVLITYYVRFPLLVVKFITKPSQVIQVIAQIADKPNILGRVCSHMKEAVNFYVGMVRYSMANGSVENQAKASIELYGNLIGGATKKDVEEALFSVNKMSQEKLIEEDTISVRLISEIGRG
jgi:hypothetical protein